MNLNLL